MTELEQELQELGGDITAALDEIALPAVLLDPEGVIRWQNKASRVRFGDRGGAKISIVVPDAGADVEAFLADVLCRGAPAEFTLRVRLPDGRIELREISAAPVRDGGSVVGIFGISTPARAPGARCRPQPGTISPIASVTS